LKIIFSFIRIVCLFACIAGCKKEDDGITQVTQVNNDTIPQLPGWKLVWNDEFNGAIVDTGKWEYEVNGSGGGNNELQYYTANPSNSFIDNGALVIRALKENYLGKQYTSARLRTKYRGDWKYGRFEIRAKLPYGKGLWPAIWMLPTDYVYGGWPKSGEIDIMECLGDNTWKTYGTIHCADASGSHIQFGGNYSLPPDSASFAGAFHVFAIEWDSTTIQWFVDGINYYTTNRSAPFDQRFHLIFNVAVGGNWPGNPNEFTVFPQTMAVDYVRVYQRP
jgi:beta-glucanase (GH16 family)